MAQYFTLDTISDIAYSEPFGCLRSDSDVNGYIQAVDDNMPKVMFTSTMPDRLHWMLNSAIARKFLPLGADEAGFDRVLGYVPVQRQEHICHRRE